MFRYNSFEKFTIASKPVDIDYIHTGVFVPVLNPTEGMDRFTFSQLSNPAMKIRYREENAYASEHMVSPGSGSGSPVLGKVGKHERSYQR